MRPRQQTPGDDLRASNGARLPADFRRAIAPLLAAALLAAACADSRDGAGGESPADPIQALVDRLGADPHGEWAAGAYPILDLPPSATVEEVIDRLFQRVRFDDGRVNGFTVLELRGVHIGPQATERHIAARVDTDLGQKIVLFRRGQQDWWARVFNIEPAG
jgi:hypothetical protein